MTYTAITWGELKARLLSRLGEETFFPATFREQCLNEALAVWQAMVGEWMTADITGALALGGGIPAACQYPPTVILSARYVNGSRVMAESSLSEFNNWKTNWLYDSTNTPSAVAPCGTAFFFLDAQNFTVGSLVLNGITEAVQYSSDASVLQLQEAEVDAIVNYAYHVALFSEGSMEFQASSVSLKKMYDLAVLRNARLSDMSYYRKFRGKDRDSLEDSKESTSDRRNGVR